LISSSTTINNNFEEMVDDEMVENMIWEVDEDLGEIEEEMR